MLRLLPQNMFLPAFTVIVLSFLCTRETTRARTIIQMRDTSEEQEQITLEECEMICQQGTRCIVRNGRPECRAMRMPGSCPPPAKTHEGACFVTCQDDADCGLTYKCCPKRCGGQSCKKAVL